MTRPISDLARKTAAQIIAAIPKSAPHAWVAGIVQNALDADATPDDRTTVIRLQTEKPLTTAQKAELGEKLGLTFALSGCVRVEVS